MSKPASLIVLPLAHRVSVLVSGWSDNGWLSGGHAVRMAMEICKSTLCAVTGTFTKS